MLWIRVEEALPINLHHVLVLVKGHWGDGDPLCMRESTKIFDGFFNVRKGWFVMALGGYSLQQHEVVGWMCRPDDLPEHCAEMKAVPMERV